MSLSLAEKLAIWKWLSDTLAAFRESDLLPEASASLPAGSRIPVMFGGKLAAWVSRPQPTQRSARIKDEAKLLAWARVHYPEKIDHPVEVKVDAGLIEYLQEHRPESLYVGEQVDPQWADDLRHAMTEPGFYITANGEKLTEVPGIEVPDPAPSAPRVNLEREATAILAEAWPEIQDALRGMLALPAPGPAPVPDAAPPPGDLPPGNPVFDEKGRFRSPEMAAFHAIHVQGGFSTPAIEARRMLRGRDPATVAMAREWLESRGLSLDGEDEPPLAGTGASDAA